jgi:hypothetical protein
MFKFNRGALLIPVALTSAASLLINTAEVKALPIGTIEPYPDTELRTNEVVFDSGFRGEKPCLFGKVNPTQVVETIIGLCQDGNSVFQASTAFRLSDSVLIAPYAQYESLKPRNQLAGAYVQINILRSGDTQCSMNGFGEVGPNNNSGWRAGLSCNFKKKP